MTSFDATSSLLRVAEDIAGELRARGRHKLGQSMFRLAAQLGHEVRRASLPMEIRAMSVRGHRRIVVRPDIYRPREEFAVAHEMIELHLPGQMRAALPHTLKEQLCNRGAAALLLPRDPFLASVVETKWELPSLRRRFHWASWKAIAKRLYELVPGVAIASWVNKERDWWRWSDGLDHAELIGAELEALRGAWGRRAVGRGRRGLVQAKAWRLVATGKSVAMVVVRKT